MVKKVPAKILIAIDSSLKEPYISLTREGPLRTWTLEEDCEVDTILYYSKQPSKFLIWLNDLIENWRWKGGSPKAYFISASLFFLLLPFRNVLPSYSTGTYFDTTVRQIQVKLPEVLFAQRWKKLAVLQYFLKNPSYNYLLFVTPSCYIRKSLLKEIVSLLPRDHGIYAGYIQKSHDGPFIAGGTILLDRDSAFEFLNHKSWIPTHTMDDVGLGIVAGKFGIELTQLPGISIDAAGLDDFARINDCFYLRFKSKVGEGRADAMLMQDFHKALQSE